MSETPTPASPYYRAPPPKKRPGWRTAMWIVVAIVVAILAAVLLTPHPDQHSRGRGGGGGRGGGMPTVVGVAAAVKGDIPINLGALGTVTPEATVTVQSQIAGTLETVNFREGQTVKKGQLLAEVDTRPYVVALAQAQGALARDQATLANAQLDLKRYQTLAKQDSVSGQQVDTQAALVRQDEGTVKTDEAGVASAKLNLVYCHITAPVSGRVGLRQVDAGNYITAGSTTGVVVITQMDPIDIVFSLPEDDVPAIQARVAQGATLSVTALDRTGATTLAQGQLLTLDNQIDTSTGTVKAKARFANPNGLLFPNQFVNVELLVNTLKDAVVIPTQAIRHGSKGDYVFTVGQDDLGMGNVARMVTVKVGPADGDRSSIASGLSVGDQVITDGGDRLTDGATILLPGHIPSMNHQKKPAGFFDWLAGLFGKKPAAGADSGAVAGASAGGGASGGNGGGGNGGGSHGGGAARMQAMFAQLNLSPDQKAKVDAIQAATRQKMQAAGDDSDARHAAMKDSMAQIDAVLNPDQKAKLADLRAQARAAMGGGAPASGSDSSSAGAAAPSSGGSASVGLPPSPVAPAPSAPDSASAPAPQASAGGGQGGGSGGGSGGGGGRMGGLFAILTDDQKVKVKAIIDQAKASGDFSGVREKIGAILTPEQRAKLAATRAAHAGGGGGDQ